MPWPAAAGGKTRLSPFVMGQNPNVVVLRSASIRGSTRALDVVPETLAEGAVRL